MATASPTHDTYGVTIVDDVGGDDDDDDDMIMQNSGFLFCSQKKKL
jgi:hypothetical protein